MKKQLLILLSLASIALAAPRPTTPTEGTKYTSDSGRPYVWINDSWQTDWAAVGADSTRPIGAVADGSSHPLSERYSTLAEAQVDYPHATSLTDEIDWAAIQSAIDSLASGSGINAKFAGRIFIPAGEFVINRTIDLRSQGVTILGEGFSKSQLLLNAPNIPLLQQKRITDIGRFNGHSMSVIEGVLFRNLVTSSVSSRGVMCAADDGSYIGGQFHISDCWFVNFDTAVYAESLPMFSIKRCNLVNNIKAFEFRKLDTFEVEQCGTGNLPQYASDKQCDLLFLIDAGTNVGLGGHNFAGSINGCELGNCRRAIDIYGGQVSIEDTNFESYTDPEAIFYITGRARVTMEGSRVSEGSSSNSNKYLALLDSTAGDHYPIFIERDNTFQEAWNDACVGLSGSFSWSNFALTKNPIASLRSSDGALLQTTVGASNDFGRLLHTPNHQAYSVFTDTEAGNSSRRGMAWYYQPRTSDNRADDVFFHVRHENGTHSRSGLANKNAMRNLFRDTTASVSTQAAYETLKDSTIPAWTMVQSLKRNVHLTYSGSFAANANAKRVQLSFSGNVFESTLEAVQGNWVMDVKAYPSMTTNRILIVGTFVAEDKVYPINFSGTRAFNAPLEIRLWGQGGAAGDVTCNLENLQFFGE